MRLVKGFLFAVAGLFVIITLFSLLIPSKVLTAKSVTINAAPPQILSAIKDFKQWKKWHPVFVNDSAHLLISNPSDKINTSLQWGIAGKKNIITLTEIFAEGIKFTLARTGENTIENSIVILPLPDSGSYQVEWKALTKLKWYPWEKFAGIFVSEITGPGYDSALKSLKSYIENPVP